MSCCLRLPACPRAFVCLLGTLLAWACLTTVSAQDVAREASASASLTLSASGCDAASFEEVRRLLRIELGERLRERVLNDTWRADLVCREDEAEIVATRSPSELPQRDQLDLHSTPPALRPRVIALRIAEIARALPTATRSLASVRPLPPPAPPDPASEPDMQLARAGELGAFAQLSVYSRDARPLWGGGARVAYRRAALSLSLEGALATRDDHQELGRVRVLVGYVAPRVTWGWQFGRFALAVGAGYAFGSARIEGHTPRAAQADRQRALWAAPYAAVELELALTRSLRLRVQGSLGFVHAGVVGEVARGDDVQLAGRWSQLQLGPAFLL